MSENVRDTATVPHEQASTSQSEDMTKATTIHNATARALVVDDEGHIVGGGETADVVADAVTFRLIDRGDVIIVTPAKSESESKTKRASRQRDVDEKNGD